jgi:hypothetical protein
VLTPSIVQQGGFSPLLRELGKNDDGQAF